MAATGVNVADSVISQFNDMKLGRIKVLITNDKNDYDNLLLLL